jgi:hypothetical protein
MKSLRTILIPLLTLTSTSALVADIFIDFEDPNELTTNWVQTNGDPDTLEQTAGSGIAGSTGVVHVDNPDGSYVHFNHLTDLGGFQDGLSLYAKIHFVQVGTSNTVSLGFITDPSGVGSLSDPEVTHDWMGVNLTCRSNFTEFRAELWGFDVDEESGVPTVFRSGAGFPESFVPIPDGNGGFADGVTAVDVWLGLEVILIDKGDGDWDIQSKIDVLNDDGTMQIDDYAVYNYSIKGGLSSTAPLLNTFSDFYNATSLYAMMGTQAGALRNFGGLDDITITVPEASTDWYGYAVDETGWANTSDWMGWVYVEYDPWVISASLNKYIYVGDDSGWVYVPN